MRLLSVWLQLGSMLHLLHFLHLSSDFSYPIFVRSPFSNIMHQTNPNSIITNVINKITATLSSFDIPLPILSFCNLYFSSLHNFNLEFIFLYLYTKNTLQFTICYLSILLISNFYIRILITNIGYQFQHRLFFDSIFR